MKKSLLALAVLGAFAGAASAQSSVTVYGIVDIGIQSNDTDVTNGRATGLASGGQSASRIGFKGTEDLGGGLSAMFQLEAGFNADDGQSGLNTLQPGVAATANNASLFSRISTVGLQGAFGAVNLGRQTSVLKDAHDQIDPFGAAGAIGNLERIFYFTPNPSAAGNLSNPGGGRLSNTIKYSSPSFSGFKAQAAYTFGETRGDTGSNSGYGLGVGYANGPLNVQFAYNNLDSSATTAPFANTYEQDNMFLGAVYNFGAFKLHGAFADNEASAPGQIDEESRNAMIGVSVPFGAFNFLASYAINDVKTAGVSNEDSKQFAIGLTYDLSKRTNLYTGYAKTSNDAGAALGGASTSPAATPTAGNDVTVFNVGVRHKF